MSNINDLIQGLKTDLNSHIEYSLKQAKPEIEKYEIYKEAYDLIVNSSIVAKLKKQIRKLERENKRLTKYVLHLTDTTTRPVKSKVREPVIFPEDVNPVVFIKIEKEDHTPNIVYELEEIERDVQQVVMREVVEDVVEEVEVEEEVVEEEVVEEEEVEEVVEEEVVEEEVEEVEVEEEMEDVVEEEVEEVVEEEVEDVIEEEVVEVEEYEEAEDVIEEVEEEDVEEEEDSEVFEHIINGVTYYITNELNGTIYGVDDSGEIGDEIGKMVNGSPVFDTQ
jgi:hypothetical protein